MKIIKTPKNAEPKHCPRREAVIPDFYQFPAKLNPRERLEQSHIPHKVIPTPIKYWFYNLDPKNIIEKAITNRVATQA